MSETQTDGPDFLQQGGASSGDLVTCSTRTDVGTGERGVVEKGVETLKILTVQEV